MNSSTKAGNRRIVQDLLGARVPQSLTILSAPTTFWERCDRAAREVALWPAWKRFRVTTGCFNRPATGVVELAGWASEEREQIRRVLTALVRRSRSTNPDYDSQIEKLTLRCVTELAPLGVSVS